jgi:hypothetical protein
MALSGTLDSFPLPEVLRLLGRSGQTGVLLVKADDQEMRAYLAAGRLLFACAGDERAVKTRLVGAGLLDREGWDKVSAGDASADEVLAEDVSALDYDRAVRSLTVDGFVEVMRRRQGSFEFEEGVTTSIRLGTELSIDDTLDEVEDRLRAWNTIREIVPSMSARIHLAETLPDGMESVELTADEWGLLGYIASGTTVGRLASRTGESEFDAASKIAALVSRGLAWVGDAVLASRNAGDLERFPGVDVTTDDPLGAEGPTGWTNELDSIAATAEPEPEEAPPLLEGEDLFPGALDTEDDEEGLDFGLKGFAPKPRLPLKDEDDEQSDDTDEAETAEEDALEMLGGVEEAEAEDSRDEADEEVAGQPTADEDAAWDGEVFADDAGPDSFTETDEQDDGPVEDVDEEEGDRPSGTLPNLLRRRNKGLLAKELSSLTD